MMSAVARAMSGVCVPETLYAKKGGLIMHTITRLTFVLGLSLVAGLFGVSAEAQPYMHTFAASTGSDTATCGQTATTPCATVAGAYLNTSPGGEIHCLDAGVYNRIEITHSITINCENVIANNTFFTNYYSVHIDNTAATDTVTLNGLELDAWGAASSGCTGQALVEFNGAGTLHLQRVKIGHILGGCSGVYFGPNGPAMLDISDSDIVDNGDTGAAAGVYIEPSSGVQAKVSITNSRITHNNFGIIADGAFGGTVRGVIKDSVVSGNVENGVTAKTSGSSVVLLLDQTDVSSNTYGVAAGGNNAGIGVRNSTIFNNTTGLFANNGGTLVTYGNNSVGGNTNNGTFTATVSQQ
jgi:hypothetical protein